MMTPNEKIITLSPIEYKVKQLLIEIREMAISSCLRPKDIVAILDCLKFDNVPSYYIKSIVSNKLLNYTSNKNPDLIQIQWADENVIITDELVKKIYSDYLIIHTTESKRIVVQKDKPPVHVIQYNAIKSDNDPQYMAMEKYSSTTLSSTPRASTPKASTIIRYTKLCEFIQSAKSRHTNEIVNMLQILQITRGLPYILAACGIIIRNKRIVRWNNDVIISDKLIIKINECMNARINKNKTPVSFNINDYTLCNTISIPVIISYKTIETKNIDNHIIIDITSTNDVTTVKKQPAVQTNKTVLSPSMVKYFIDNNDVAYALKLIDVTNPTTLVKYFIENGDMEYAQKLINVTY